MKLRNPLDIISPFRKNSDGEFFFDYKQGCRLAIFSVVVNCVLFSWCLYLTLTKGWFYGFGFIGNLACVFLSYHAFKRIKKNAMEECAKKI